MASNPDRDAVLSLITAIHPPANFRVVLDVDRSTENLRVRVLKAKPWELRFWGRLLYQSKVDWDDPQLEQRRITGRSYSSILEQLQSNPEFLEFEVVVGGHLLYHEAVGII